MAPPVDTGSIFDHIGALSILWTVSMFLLSGVIAYVSATVGIKHSIKSHDSKFAEYSKRISKLEQKAEISVTFPTCRLEQIDCRAAHVAEIVEIKNRLDLIMTMFQTLEERRNRRWSEYEIRREEQKDVLNANLAKMSRQLICLEAAVMKKHHQQRTSNGILSEEDHTDEG